MNVKPFKLAAPKAFHPKEFDEQCFIFEWRKYAVKQYPELRLLYATLNGVRVPIGLAVKMKRAGMTRGINDIVLPTGHAGFFSFYCELKREEGAYRAPSDEQVDMHILLEEQNNYVVTCKGAKACIAQLEWYLQQPRTETIIRMRKL